jgi:DnaJ-class molecular chaperone
MTFDPYAVLGIAKTATQNEIKKAHRKFAKKYHPDLNPGNSKAEKKFIEITKAYELLETPIKREKFDRGEFEQAQSFSSGGGAKAPFYHETQNGGGRYTYSFEAAGNDIFDSLFNNFNTNQTGEFNAPGGDQFYRMEVEFKDTILGAEREITFPPDKRFKVKIPAGIETGKKLRFAGQGSPGLGKGAAGDSYIEIQVKPSPVFKRVGNDLEMELAVSLSEAILGGTVEILTLEKPIKLKIPPGANTGQRLRVKNKGVMDATLKTRGNLIVILKVVLPSKIDADLKEMIQTWSQSHTYNPRENSKG